MDTQLAYNCTQAWLYYYHMVVVRCIQVYNDFCLTREKKKQ